MLLAAFLFVAATSASGCSAPLNGVAVTSEQRFDGVSADHVVDAFFSERVGRSLTERTGMRRREVLRDDVTSDGVRHRRVRVWLPSPKGIAASLPGVPPDDELFYDEILTFDPHTREAQFYVVTPACERVKYGGTIRFSQRGDDTVVKFAALLDFDAPLVGAVLEPVVVRGVRDGYDKLAIILRDAL